MEVERLKNDGAEMERLKINEFQLLRGEIEGQRNLISRLVKVSDIESLRVELERQGKLIEGLVNLENGQSLRTENQSLTVRDLSSQSHNCTEAKTNGIYNLILPKFSSEPFKVACDAKTRGGGWTIILRRMDGSVEFNRTWTEYKNGFGNLSGEYFLGLDKIHAITAERRQELLIVLENFDGYERFETYDEFGIGDENQQYVLHTLGKANGNAGDSFSSHKGSRFSTFDRDNEDWEQGHCAEELAGGWWFSYCGPRFECILTVL